MRIHPLIIVFLYPCLCSQKMLDFELAGLDLGLSIATRMAILRCAEKFYFELLLGVMARHEAAERQLMVGGTFCLDPVPNAAAC